jgi:hypothetical protein
MYCHLARPLLPLHTASAHAFYHLTSYFGMSDARWHVRPKHAVTSPCVRVRLTLLGGVVPLFSVGCGHESSEAALLPPPARRIDHPLVLRQPSGGCSERGRQGPEQPMQLGCHTQFGREAGLGTMNRSPKPGWH